MGSIEGYPSSDAVERLTGKIDHKDPLTTQLMKKVDNGFGLLKQHLAAGQSQGLSGPNNPHGIGITRYTISVPFYNGGENVSKRVLIAQDISDLWMSADLWVIPVYDTAGSTFNPEFWALGQDSLDGTVQEEHGFNFWSDDDDAEVFEVKQGGARPGISGVGGGHHSRFNMIRTYTGKTASIGFGETMTATLYPYTGDPTRLFKVYEDATSQRNLAVWKDGGSGYLMASQRQRDSNDVGFLMTGHIDLTIIPNTGFLSQFALTGEPASTEHRHKTDLFTSDGTDSFVTSEVFDSDSTEVTADGFDKIRTLHYYEDTGLQAVNFGTAVSSGIHVRVSYTY